MVKKKKKVPPTVWEALNEPVIEVTPDAAKAIFTVAAFLMVMAWVTPYWPAAAAHLAAAEELGMAPSEYTEMVAGASIAADESASYGSVPIYGIVQEVQGAFVSASSEVLDVSEPAGELIEFYEPGVDAVWNAWLELMVDPEF